MGTAEAYVNRSPRFLWPYPGPEVRAGKHQKIGLLRMTLPGLPYAESNEGMIVAPIGPCDEFCGLSD